MRKLFIGTFVILCLFSACKSKQILPKQDTAATETVTKQEPATKVFSAPAAQPVPQQQSPAPRYESSKPVRSQSESFTFAQQDDAGNYQGKFFVIVGSFSSMENANRYKQELIPQGFAPIVLHSETGYYRVCVNAYTDETAARQRVQQIRTDYPKYADTWLLIKK
ncbi:MAG: SPOR domain-containing protein [Mangrovibacterium sp.]|nr:SPOR domain-containing protein [Mangrovibacterium sp.]